MATPHEPENLAEERLERASRAREEWESARAAVEELIASGALSGEQLARAREVVGHHEHQRRRWGPAPS